MWRGYSLEASKQSTSNKHQLHVRTADSHYLDLAYLE